MKKLGIFIIVIGLLMAVVTGFNVLTHEKPDVGDAELTHHKDTDINWAPLVGVAVMAFGGVIYYFAGKKA